MTNMWVFVLLPMLTFPLATGAEEAQAPREEESPDEGRPDAGGQVLAEVPEVPAGGLRAPSDGKPEGMADPAGGRAGRVGGRAGGRAGGRSGGRMKGKGKSRRSPRKGNAKGVGAARAQGFSGGQCKDTYSWCPSNTNYCQGYYASYMFQNCPYSCKFCTPAPACSDNYQYAASCPFWAFTMRYCSGQFGPFMTANCPKSCNKCGGGSAGTCKCGIKKTNRITGGDKTEVNEYPWIAIFADGNGKNQGGCAATLIASNWAVTAAHCVRDKNGQPSKTVPTVTIVLGVHDRMVESDPLRKVVHLAAIIVHYDYNYVTLENDIALLKLAESVDLNVYTPVCLPAQGTDYQKASPPIKAWVAGWGWMPNGKGDMILAHKLQDLEVPIVSDAVCTVSYKKSALCAGGLAGKATCKGDSGGPLTVVSSGKHTLAGIVSSGSYHGCGKEGTYTHYTEVGYFRNWMDSTIAANGGATSCQ